MSNKLVTFISLGWLVFALVAWFLMKEDQPNRDAYLVSAINLSLFVFLFSKQKHEDEFSAQIRFKSLAYSFVYFLAMVGAFGALDIYDNNGSKMLNPLNLQILIGAAMFSTLLYFYITVYKIRKS